jgi:hypothetical protein
MRVRSRTARRVLPLFLWVAASATPLAAQDFESRFARHVIRLQLPAGYRLEGEAVPQPGMKTLAFATSPRKDGTRGLIQVTLLDMKQGPPGEAVTLEKFAEAMIGGVRRRRTDWRESGSSSTIAGVPGKRIEWSGSSEASPERPADRPPAPMRGVMFVGIKEDLGFVLHTQDFATFADQALPLGEKALQTFTATLDR